MILGDVCTRNCAYCAVAHGTPAPLDAGEPQRLADAVAQMGLKHVVITSVDRDDLPNGGAEVFAACITEIRLRLPQTSVEVLIPDFKGNPEALRLIVDARPDILNHNLETIGRLYRIARPGGRYPRALELLDRAKDLNPELLTKSGIICGLGARGPRRHSHHRPVPAALRSASAHRALVHAGRIRRAQALRHVARIPACRIGPAGQVQLSRLGASGGSDRMTATARTPKQNAPSPQQTDLHVKMLRQMLLIRRFEEKAAEAYALGKIGGFCHLYIGQEAVAVGALAALRDDDYVICSYREHGQALIKGISANAVMAELFGKATGCSKGKGGSMHLFDAKRGFMGGHGIVGGHIPLGAGLAFASKYKGTEQVTVCFFGEAAVNIGAFHETLNMASVWKLPVIFLCENNRYGMGTAFERVAAVTDIVEHACSYDMAAELVDGMNVLTVHDATRRAVERARKQSHPTLLEVRTYRYMGHSMSDPLHGVYRTKDEVEEQKARDPISHLAGKLKEDGVIDQAALDALDAEIHAEVEGAVKFADESPDPEPGELFTDVLVD